MHDQKLHSISRQIKLVMSFFIYILDICNFDQSIFYHLLSA